MNSFEALISLGGLGEEYSLDSFEILGSHDLEVKAIKTDKDTGLKRIYRRKFAPVEVSCCRTPLIDVLRNDLDDVFGKPKA